MLGSLNPNPTQILTRTHPQQSPELALKLAHRKPAVPSQIPHPELFAIMPHDPPDRRSQTPQNPPITPRLIMRTHHPRHPDHPPSLILHRDLARPIPLRPTIRTRHQPQSIHHLLPPFHHPPILLDILPGQPRSMKIPVRLPHHLRLRSTAMQAP